MNLEESLSKLYSLHSFGVKLGLENIREFLSFIGNPQDKLKCFHVAGSNGKGSTSSFLASILMEYKCKVGLYTSPHFVRFNERIKVNGQEIPDEYIASFINKYNDKIDELKLTFFEVTTALAFMYFYEKKVDYAVIETGLGGRLDATNIIKKPLAAIITSISLEHTNILGNTIKEVAAEKAGIIKNGSMVFIGKLHSDAEEVIEAKCSDTGSELFKIKEYINEKRNSPELYTEEIEYDDWNIPLRGIYQTYNAALAGLVISKVLDEEDPDFIRKGIADVIRNTGIQGRYELFHKEPDIIFDSAHNPEGIENFLTEFRTDYKIYRNRELIFGAMRDKSIKEMLQMLNKFFDTIYITGINYERAATTDELFLIAKENSIKVTVLPEPVNYIRNFTKKNRYECLVVLGSMYMLGEIKSHLTDI